MRIKLLLDEDVHPPLAEALRQRGYDAVHVQEVGRKGIADAEQLGYAVAQQRCLVSFNVGDFARLHVAYTSEGKAHSGIILSKQLPIGDVLRQLVITLERFSQENIKNRLEFL